MSTARTKRSPSARTAPDSSAEWTRVAAYLAGLSVVVALDLVEAPIAIAMVGLRLCDVPPDRIGLNTAPERLLREFLTPLRSLGRSGSP